jgi:hypothetical protein
MAYIRDMGLREDGAKRAAALDAARRDATGVQAEHDALQQPPWLDELVAAVSGRVDPVNFVMSDVVHDRTPIMRYQRATVTYRYLGPRWVILGLGMEGEHGPMREGFSFDTKQIYSDAGEAHVPSEGKGRHGMEIVNRGLQPGPMRRAGGGGSHLAGEVPRMLAALAVHLLADNACGFPQPGVIHVGSLVGR